MKKGIKISLVIILVGGVLLMKWLFNPEFVGLDYNSALKKAQKNHYNITFVSATSDKKFGIVIKEKKKDNNYKLYVSTGANVNKQTFTSLKANLELIKSDNFKIVSEKADFSKNIPKNNLLMYDVDFNKRTLKYQVSLGNETIKTKIRLAAVGDILIHDTIYQDAKTTNGYDFNPIFKQIKNQFAGYDLVYANQESLAAGTQLGLSSYPTFNSPVQITDALVNLRVNMIARANNHALDKGAEGIIFADRYYSKFKNIVTAGAQSSKQARDSIRIINKKDIKIAFLNYTYGFNGFELPAGKEYLSNLFTYDQVKIDLAKARKQADLIIVAMHWGTEYAPYPNEEQIKQAKFLNEQGVDIILGGHPHVLEPVDYLKGENNQETFVIYSLGNFVSAQDELPRLVGGILSMDINIERSYHYKKISFQNVKLMPTYNYPTSGLSNYTIVSLANSSQKSYFQNVERLMASYTKRIKVVARLNNE